MADATGKREIAPDRALIARWELAVANAARSAGPPLLFGLRLWAAVCLATYVAFWLELDNAFWAPVSAALVCQPHLGASLRKGWFRMIGTVIGAVAIVVLTAWFPQDRFWFLVSLALWVGASALVTTLLHNFAAYAAALAGYTAVIIASDQLGATGGLNGEAFTLAITRVSEIWIGIVCAGIVLAGTDFGAAPRRLAAQFAAVSAEIARGFASTLAQAGFTSTDTLQPARRELIRRVIALDPVVDEAVGESSTLRYRSPELLAAIEGLFATLAAWRSIVMRLVRLPKDTARQNVDAVLLRIPPELRSAARQGEPEQWMAEPSETCRAFDAAARELTVMPAGTPSLRLIADQTARVLAGFAAVLDGLALLAGASPGRGSRHRFAKLYVPDWLPALINGARGFVTICAVEIFWIATAWPNGALAIIFAAIVVTLLAPRAEEAYTNAVSFMTGTALAAVCAAITLFALLPNVVTFAGFSLVIALYLIPVGALAAQPWQTFIFVAMTYNFVPMLMPANQMSYDTIQFYNSALAIVLGCGAGALSYRLLPPLSPAFRARRLLALTLRDLRRLATGVVRWLPDDWEGRINSRLAALPDAAEPLQRAQLVTALSVGNEIIHLRNAMPGLGFGSELDSALEALAQGNSVAAGAELERLDHRLASLPDSDPQSPAMLGERGRILLICDALANHRAYFDGGEAS
jgi:uncharacterized membrane protein YccC